MRLPFPEILFLALGASHAMAQTSRMFDPALDDPNREWCFLAKSTTVIGLPFQPDVTQITWDGALYTRICELDFFYGPDMKPMVARQKTFLGGWMPLVEYGWKEGGIRYSYEAFAAQLRGTDTANTVNFVRFTLTNTSRRPLVAVLGSAIRAKLDDSRFGGAPFKPSALLAFAGSRIPRSESFEQTVGDGQAILLLDPGSTPKMACLLPSQLRADFPTGASRPAREEHAGVGFFETFGESYRGPFHAASPSEPVCVAKYRVRLRPGERREFVFKMPRVPVDMSDQVFLSKLSSSDYGRMRDQTIAFWHDAILGNSQFLIPEDRVRNAQRASLVHMMLATRTRDGRTFQTDGLPYPDLFLSSLVQAQMAYDFLGRDNDYLRSLDVVLGRQTKEGIFADDSLPQNGQPLIAAHGQTLFSLCYHYLLTRDSKYALRVLPAIERAVAWIGKARHNDPYGLLPPSWPYDNEMILGHYTSHNLWCLLGVRTAIRFANALGRTDLAKEWTLLEQSYESSVLVALRTTGAKVGYVPPGLYDYKTGAAARVGFKEYQTGQDWENMLLCAPTEILSPDDPLVTATLAHLHKDKFREGVMTYRDGEHLHQYITANVIEQEMARGDQRQALIDLYHLLLHDGPTFEGFENLVEPWTRQIDLSCPPPHAWASMKTALVIRNALLVERGGKAGMREPQRDLHLFSPVSPAWAKQGSILGFKNALCEMGRLTALMRFRAGGAILSLSAQWRKPPRELFVRVPYFVRLTGFSCDRPAKLADGEIELDPRSKWLILKWVPRPEVDRGVIQNLLLAYRREPDFELKNGEGVVTASREGA